MARSGKLLRFRDGVRSRVQVSREALTRRAGGLSGPGVRGVTALQFIMHGLRASPSGANGEAVLWRGWLNVPLRCGDARRAAIGATVRTNQVGLAKGIVGEATHLLLPMYFIPAQGLAGPERSGQTHCLPMHLYADPVRRRSTTPMSQVANEAADPWTVRSARGNVSRFANLQ